MLGVRVVMYTAWLCVCVGGQCGDVHCMAECVCWGSVCSAVTEQTVNMYNGALQMSFLLLVLSPFLYY